MERLQEVRPDYDATGAHVRGHVEVLAREVFGGEKSKEKGDGRSFHGLFNSVGGARKV